MTTDNLTYKGFTPEQLGEAFSRMHDPDDWKGPILATMPGELVMLGVAAIEFYTATTPSVDLNVKTMQYTLSSPGYRAGPAGDH